ncbi:MAG: hypothetical protein J0H73_13340 [Salana multivorans]|uniref:hypothetical protein n=1 Tax=Salana multivorans TaxID=120377 RepID=UPI000A41FECF|nr:hypothetical protein [Salana multivorans]MBN8883285.1 hypothetical protein [Salana multivorans]
MTVPEPEDRDEVEPAADDAVADAPDDGADDGAGSEPDERDWDAEWRDLTGPLAAEPRRFLLSDTPRIGAGTGPRDYSPPDDPDDESWHPEEPPPATGSTRTRLAWAGIIGGPLLMLLAVVTFGSAEVWFVGLSLVLFVGGCALGFSQLPKRHRDPDDDGAEV